MPKPLDLNTLSGHQTLEKLSEEKEKSLHGKERHEWLTSYGWELVRRGDDISKDYRLPCKKERLGYIILVAARAIKFQVFLNLTRLGLIKRGERITKLEDIFGYEEENIKCQ